MSLRGTCPIVKSSAEARRGCHRVGPARVIAERDAVPHGLVSGGVGLFFPPSSFPGVSSLPEDTVSFHTAVLVARAHNRYTKRLARHRGSPVETSRQHRGFGC